MQKEHSYSTTIEWTGNSGEGTREYSGYERSHRISVTGKAVIEASADPAFRGDASKYNPEELFLASLSSCHMLWYLHLCSANDIVVVSYKDEATGTMVETGSGGYFTEVILHPEVTISDKRKVEKANALHQEAHTYCFIASSCNFPVRQQPLCVAT